MESAQSFECARAAARSPLWRAGNTAHGCAAWSAQKGGMGAAASAPQGGHAILCALAVEPRMSSSPPSPYREATMPEARVTPRLPSAERLMDEMQFLLELCQ